MKKFSFALVAFSLMVGASAGDLRTEINAMNKKVHAAMIKRDADLMAKVIKPMVTPDFKYTEDGRTMTFDEMVAQMKMGFGMMKKIIKADSKILTLKVDGDKGKSTERHTVVAMMMGPDKKLAKMEMTGMSEDTYKKVGGKWMMSSMNWKNTKMMMNGKPMDMSKMGAGEPK